MIEAHLGGASNCSEPYRSIVGGSRVLGRPLAVVRGEAGGMTIGSGQIGIHLGTEVPPDDLPQVAALGEQLGFDEVLVGEDVAFTAGISAATACLAATEHVLVEIGIVSAVLRQPAVLAMEMATMSRMYPGRDVICGIGLGVPTWLRQMNVLPKSQLGALRECAQAVRKLLDGEKLDVDGDYFHFHDIGLAHPPERYVPIYMGSVGPKMLELSGEICDGTFLSVDSSPQYVSWARERIAAGAARSGRDPAKHRVCTLAMFSMDDDGAAARERIRHVTAWWMAAMGANALTEAYGIAEEVRDMISRSGQSVDERADTIAREMPDAWLRDLVIAGDPDECADTITRLFAAGSDSVALFPIPVTESEAVFRAAARELLPRLR